MLPRPLPEGTQACFSPHPSGNPLGGTCRLVQALRQQNRGEEPSLSRRPLLSPALSVEAWDPAITSAWARLLPLPGSAPSIRCPWSQRQGPSRGLGHLRGLLDGPGCAEGTPTTLWLGAPVFPFSPHSHRTKGL
ncbi:hypothetical protein mRhiFer1_009647 [Rhinolophus ferrumequinum]|uniref:Uncharacterized protein n=1 Tax=Rhinolophus ferrumequinum TaxID=59479 RepID=A0A7J7R5Y1_RHIFE|nr:hypothetical protein mRhiFer1_009647 [Rhinolophus ferrumequinum]